VVAKENLVEYLVRANPEVLLTMGAGDIDTLIQPIAEALKTK
jgi:UDP-N-acetylmuramate-alanine ligase